jgi:tetratricopeptide (TPR) repeat protein
MKRSLLVFIFILQRLFAQVNDPAATYAEAGLYDQAIKLYQEYLQDNQDPYDQAITRYNIGTTYLKAGEWEDALKELNTVILLNNLSPPLKQGINLNIALAIIHSVEIGLNEAKTRTQVTQLDLLLDEALRALKTSQKAECELQKIEGYTNCTSSPSFQIILNKWSDLKSKVVEKAKDTSQLREVFLDTLAQKDPLIATNNELVKEITQATNHTPIDLDLLTKIKNDITSFNDALEKSNLPAEIKPIMKEWLKTVSQGMQNAIEAAKKDPEMALAYLKYSRLYALIALNELIWIQSNGPDEVIGQLLDEQSNVIDITESYLDISHNTSPGNLIPILSNAQKSVFNKVEQFVVSVYQFQQDQYHGRNKDKQCQKGKWTGVLNDFDKGYQEALKATNLLSLSTPDVRSTLIAQKSALNDWQKALEQLIHEENAVPNQQSTEEQSKTQKALQLLSEINTNDQVPAPKPTPTQSVERPW